MRHFGFRRNYQVAQYFDVTPQTLSGWIKSGEIPLKHLIKFTNEINSKTVMQSLDKDFDYPQNEQAHLNRSRIKEIS